MSKRPNPDRFEWSGEGHKWPNPDTHYWSWEAWVDARWFVLRWKADRRRRPDISSLLRAKQFGFRDKIGQNP
jgi:hypothetical protein